MVTGLSVVGQRIFVNTMSESFHVLRKYSINKIKLLFF